MSIRFFCILFLLFLSIGKLTAQDVWLQNYFSPNSGCGLSNLENVNVLINNNSGVIMPSNTIQVYYSVDGGMVVNQPLSSNLFPGSSWNFSFSINANLSACGNHTMKVWVSRSGDLNHLNDTLQWSVLNDCISSPATIVGSTTVCQGENTVGYSIPSVLNATSYVWTLPNGASGSSSTNSISVDYGTTAVSGNVSVEVIKQFCPNTISTQAIIVNPLPDTAGAFIGLVDVCQGQDSVLISIPVVLNANTYVWNLPLGFIGASDSNSIVLSLSTLANSGIISVYGENSCGNGTSIIDTIEVLSLPIANAGNDTLICEGSEIALNATGGSIFTWDNGVVQGQTFTPLATETYNVTVFDGFCSSSDSVEVIVSIPPNLPTISLTGNTITSSEQIGNQWFLNNGILLGENGSEITPTISGNYSVIVTDSNGCVSDTSNVVFYSMASVLDFTNSELVNVYPNPSNGVITIELVEQSNLPFNLKLINSFGQLIFSEVMLNGKMTFQIENFGSGFYTLVLESDNSQYLSKLLLK